MHIEVTPEELRLLREAMSEFIHARGYDAEGVPAYVAQRYDYCTPEQQAAHITRVIARVRLAHHIRSTTLQPDW